MKDRSGILFSVLLIEVEMRSEKDIADTATKIKPMPFFLPELGLETSILFLSPSMFVYFFDILHVMICLYFLISLLPPHFYLNIINNSDIYMIVPSSYKVGTLSPFVCV